MVGSKKWMLVLMMIMMTSVVNARRRHRHHSSYFRRKNSTSSPLLTTATTTVTPLETAETNTTLSMEPELSPEELEWQRILQNTSIPISNLESHFQQNELAASNHSRNLSKYKMAKCKHLFRTLTRNRAISFQTLKTMDRKKAYPLVSNRWPFTTFFASWDKFSVDTFQFLKKLREEEKEMARKLYLSGGYDQEEDGEEEEEEEMDQGVDEQEQEQTSENDSYDSEDRRHLQTDELRQNENEEEDSEENEEVMEEYEIENEAEFEASLQKLELKVQHLEQKEKEALEGIISQEDEETVEELVDESMSLFQNRLQKRFGRQGIPFRKIKSSLLEHRLKNPTRFAYLISAHDYKTMQGVLNLLDDIYTPHDTFIIHIDKKLPDCVSRRFQNFIQNNYPKAITMNARYDVKWGRMSIVEMTLHMMFSALELARNDPENHRWDTLINLCGHTRPMTSTEYRRFVVSQYPRNMIFFGMMDKLSDRSNRMYKRTKARCIKEPMPQQNLTLEEGIEAQNSSRLLKRSPKKLYVYRKCKKMTHTPDGRLIYKGEQWFFLSREFCKYIMQDKYLVPRWYEFFKTTLIPDESFFQTILMNSPFKHHLTRSLHDRIYEFDFHAPIFTTWDSPCRYKNGSYSPCYLGLEDITQIYPKSLFARKIRSNEPLDITLQHVFRLNRRYKEEMKETPTVSYFHL